MIRIAAATVTLLAVSTAAQAETYRLVHAIGNTERVSAKGLSKAECEKRKAELKAVATGLAAGGSITCLPESLFQN